ncbi:MAG: thioredoxin [Patescibacteria group bacterium]
MEFNDNNFENEVIKSGAPVLVDFFAPWCGPCKIQGPIIDELSNEMNDGKVKIGKVNVDANQAVAEKFGIMSIPTLMIFKNGEVVEVMMGLQNKESLKEKLLKLI